MALGGLRPTVTAKTVVRPLVVCVRPDRATHMTTWSEKAPKGKWRAYTYDELAARDSAT